MNHAITALPWDRWHNPSPLSPHHHEPVIIIGAGLAGCWTARCLAQQGVKVQVLERGRSPACGASGNPVGIVKPYVTRSPSFAMRFYLEAHAFLLRALHAFDLEPSSQLSLCGVLQQVRQHWPDSEYYTLGHNMLRFDQAGRLNPAALCHALLEHKHISVSTECEVNAIDSTEPGLWCVRTTTTSISTRHLVLTTGAATLNGLSHQHLSLIPARGQISRFRLSEPWALQEVINGKHYLIPDVDGHSVWVGATFERDNTSTKIRETDHHSNRRGFEQLYEDLPPALLKKHTSVPPNNTMPDTAILEGCAGVRATTPDRLPLVGPVPDFAACLNTYHDICHGRNLHDYPELPLQQGLYILTGLGSRGIVTSAYSASLLSDYIAGRNSIMPWVPLINPARFCIRALKRQR